MLRARSVRLLAVLGLLGVLFGLCIWYGSLAPDPGMGAFPGNDELGPTYDRYVGEEVAVSGTIVNTDPEIIVVEYGVDGELHLQVIDLDESVPVTEGDQLRVYGIAEPDRTVRALNAFAVPRIGLWYMWSVSFLAGLWVLGRIVRYWRFDREILALRPRGQPLRARSLVRRRTVEVSEDA